MSDEKGTRRVCWYCAATKTHMWWRREIEGLNHLANICAACWREGVHRGKRGAAFSRRRSRNLDGPRGAHR